MLTTAERDRRRRLVRTLVLAVLVAALAWFVGVHWVQSLLLGAAVTVIGTVVGALDRLDDDPQLPPVDDGGGSSGARREVSRLSWAMAGPENRVGDVPFRRIRAIADTRLRLRGLDPDDPDSRPAVEELLGPRAYAVLVADATRNPTVAVFEQCLTVLEGLDEQGPVAPAGSRASRRGGSDHRRMIKLRGTRKRASR